MASTWKEQMRINKDLDQGKTLNWLHEYCIPGLKPGIEGFIMAARDYFTKLP